MKPPFIQGILLLAVLILLTGSTILLVESQVRTYNRKTPRVPPVLPSQPLPPTGGLPEETLRLHGLLTYDEGIYKLEVTALPGYVVPLRFKTPDLEMSAAAHLWQNITVWGQWDKAQPLVFVVESILVQP